MNVLRRMGETLLCGVVLAACSGGPEQQLAGSWESDDCGRVNHLDLRADGSLTGSLRHVDFAGNAIPDGKYAGSWRFKRGHLNLLIIESTVASLAPGYTSSDEILELTGEELLVRSASGHEESWQRVP